MNYTERKYCDACQKEAVHVKGNEEEGISEECLLCGWREWKQDIEEHIEEEGIEEAKKLWIKTRDGKTNREIVKELNPREKAEWFKIVYWTNKRLGLSPLESPWKNEQDEQKPKEQPFDYKPWLISGGIGLVVGILIGLLINLRSQSNNRY